jgi:hypothetical protein
VSPHSQKCDALRVCEEACSSQSSQPFSDDRPADFDAQRFAGARCEPNSSVTKPVGRYFVAMPFDVKENFSPHQFRLVKNDDTSIVGHESRFIDSPKLDKWNGPAGTFFDNLNPAR